MKKKMPKEQQTPFKELTLSQKIAYIFGYYKYYMLTALILIVVIGSTVYTITKITMTVYATSMLLMAR